jgi:FkbM family methyltransferase
MKNLFKNLLKYFGYQLFPYPDPDQTRRIKIVNNYDINLLLDIGANDGQYVRDMRELGYDGKIISFEPMITPFVCLQKSASIDENWEVYNLGLGDRNMISKINVAGNSGSSSILNMLPVHVDNSPESQFIGEEKINIKTVDSVVNDFNIESKNLMMKIDVQGYEMNVLKGAKNSLQFVRILQLEMSLIPLYQGETLFYEMIEYLRKNDFDLVSIENGFSNRTTGELLQVDGIFINRNFR